MNTVCTITKGSKIRTGALHLTQKVDYGLFLLATLAKHHGFDTLSSIASIAKKNHLSFSFLQKVANLLKREGLIASVRGKDGGYRLARRLDSIRLKDIIEALEGPILIARCLDEGALQCPRADFCTVRAGVEKMNTEIQEVYLSKKLSDFLS